MKAVLLLALVCLSSVGAVRVLARHGQRYYPGYGYDYTPGYVVYEEPQTQQEYYREKEQRSSQQSHSESHSYEVEQQSQNTNYQDLPNYGGQVYEVEPRTGGCESLPPQNRAACYIRQVIPDEPRIVNPPRMGGCDTLRSAEGRAECWANHQRSIAERNAADIPQVGGSCESLAPQYRAACYIRQVVPDEPRIVNPPRKGGCGTLRSAAARARCWANHQRSIEERNSADTPHVGGSCESLPPQYRYACYSRNRPGYIPIPVIITEDQAPQIVGNTCASLGPGAREACEARARGAIQIIGSSPKN